MTTATLQVRLWQPNRRQKAARLFILRKERWHQVSCISEHPINVNLHGFVTRSRGWHLRSTAGPGTCKRSECINSPAISAERCSICWMPGPSSAAGTLLWVSSLASCLEPACHQLQLRLAVALSHQVLENNSGTWRLWGQPQCPRSKGPAVQLGRLGASRKNLRAELLQVVTWHHPSHFSKS